MMQYQNLTSHKKKHTHSTIGTLMSSIKKGSGTYRKIISRSHKRPDIHNPQKWKSKISDTLVTRAQVKQSMVNLQSKYISSDMADILSRLKLGKTLFRSQLNKISLSDTPFCTTCTRELNIDCSENITHATYHCSFVSIIISEITNTFFPNLSEGCCDCDCCDCCCDGGKTKSTPSPSALVGARTGV